MEVESVWMILRITEKDEVWKWEFGARREGVTGALPKGGVDVEDRVVDAVATFYVLNGKPVKEKF